MKFNPMTYVVIGLFIAIMSYFAYDSISYDIRIKKTKINAKVTVLKWSHGRCSIYFAEGAGDSSLKLKVTEDIKIGYDNYFYNQTFDTQDDVKPGDSVSKAAGSLILKLFKKDVSGQYRLFKTYNGN